MTSFLTRGFAAAALAASALAPLTAAAVPFTPGNVVVYRIGDGGSALGAVGHPVFLDEYTPAGGLVQSVAMPPTGSGAQKGFTASGTATTDGLLTRSADGSCLLVPGYGRDLGTGSGNVAGSGTLPGGLPIPRVVGRVTATAAIDTSTALTDLAVQSNFRSAGSPDCANLWVTGVSSVTPATGGVHFATLGATTSVDLSSAALPNVRAVGIFNGQLYVSAAGTGMRGINVIGTGLPTSAQPIARLPGITDTNSPSNYAFFLATLGGGPGPDTLYFADDGAGALSKFTLQGGVWTASGTVGVATDLYRGVTGRVSGSTVTLFATRRTASAGAPGGELVTLVDASGFGGTLAGAPTVIATAPTNKIFRGVALAPEITVTSSAGPNGSIVPGGPVIAGGGTTASFTVTPDSGYTALVGGTCGGALVGNTYTTNPLTANCTVSATFTQVTTFTVTPSADANGSINPNTPVTVLSGANTSFTITPSPGYAPSVGGTCGGTLVGTTYTTDPVNADCTVSATFTLVTFTVTPSASANGSIAPATPQTITSGATAMFTVTPDAGFQAAMGGTCGGVLSGGVYTTNPVSADCTVTATFAPLPDFMVTPLATPNGTIAPNTPQSVQQGATTVFTVTPDPGFQAIVRGSCGGTLVGNTYTTNAIGAACTVAVTFSTKRVLFVGNSYTFGRVDPVMSYNAADVTDLTWQMWIDNPAGTNVDEPHPWGGIPGVFKKFTDEAGLSYDVSISARNAASLRGHYLNSNPAGWDLRGNVASQKYDTVVIQDLSDEPLPAGRSVNADLPYFNAYADKFEAWVHVGAAESYTETSLFGGTTAACQAATGASASACDTLRNIAPANANANAAADVVLYQTWARPDLIAPNGSNADGTTYTAAEGLETMTGDFHAAYFGRAGANPNYKAVAPVGDAFLRAVTEGIAMRDPYVPEAGKINLWHTDFFHPSKYGSYLSALVHFATITGIDPTTLGAGEQAAADMGIAPADAQALQNIAKLTVSPLAPGIGTATAGNAQAGVAFTPPDNIGRLPIAGYVATCSAPGDTQTANGTVSPVVVTSLANGTAYSCTVQAFNSVGASLASAAVNVTPLPALALTAVQSRKTHGAAGSFDLPVDATQPIGGALSVESRIMGAGHTIVFQFNNPVAAAGTVAAVDPLGAPVGTVSAAVSGNDVVVTLSDIPENQRVTISLTNVDGAALDVSASIAFLVGDANGTGAVNSSDISGVKARSGQVTDAANFRYDLNVTGAINSSDISAVKARSGRVLN